MAEPTDPVPATDERRRGHQELIEEIEFLKSHVLACEEKIGAANASLEARLRELELGTRPEALWEGIARMLRRSLLRTGKWLLKLGLRLTALIPLWQILFTVFRWIGQGLEWLWEQLWVLLGFLW